jgi:hypothetical protein
MHGLYVVAQLPQGYSRTRLAAMTKVTHSTAIANRGSGRIGLIRKTARDGL